MDIEIVRTTHDTYRLYDGDRFLAVCGAGVKGEERAKAVWDEIMNLQTANDVLLAELEAARAVIDQARRGFGTEADIERAWAFDPVALCAAIRRYDACIADTTTTAT